MTFSQLTIPTFTNISIPFLKDIPFLFIIFITFFIVYAIVSIILIYHWSQYGTHKGTMLFTEILFLTISLCLFTVAFLALNYY